MDYRAHHLRVVVPLLCAWTAALAQEAGHSVFKGVVTTNAGNQPLSGVEVNFKEANRSVRSGDDGRFVVAGLAAGKYNVTVRRPGFRPLTGDVTLGAADTIDYKFNMLSEVTGLSAVEVVDTSVPPQLREFDRRRRTTGGSFLTQADLSRTGSQNLANIIRTKVSGFDLVRHPSGSGTALASKHKGITSFAPQGMNDCYAQIWLNGQIFWGASVIKDDYPPRLEDFNIQEISAIEFYRGGGEVPPELNMRGSNCGVAMIWTQVVRRGRPH